MKFKLGEVVRFNSKVPNRELVGCLGVISYLNPTNDFYPYMIRTISPQTPGEHLSGNIQKEWVDHV